MAEFADRMKSFTDHLRSSITMRNEALAQVRSETEDLRDRTNPSWNRWRTSIVTEPRSCTRRWRRTARNVVKRPRNSGTTNKNRFGKPGPICSTCCPRRASRVRTPPRSCVKRFSRLVASWPRICPRRQLRGMHSPRGRMSPSRHPLPCPRNGRMQTHEGWQTSHGSPSRLMMGPLCQWIRHAHG